MSSEQMFESAYEAIAEVIAKGACVPDHRERPREPIVVTAESPRREVVVTVSDAKISSVWIDERWFEDTAVDGLADVLTGTVNAALEEWNRKQLDELMTATPDLRELDVAIKAAHEQLDAAWVRTLAESKAV